MTGTAWGNGQGSGHGQERGQGRGQGRDRDRERSGDMDTDPLNVKNDANLGYDSIWVHMVSIHEINKGKKYRATVSLSCTR